MPTNESRSCERCMFRADCAEVNGTREGGCKHYRGSEETLEMLEEMRL